MAIILTFYPIFNLQIRNLLWNRPLVFGIMIITNLFKQNREITELKEPSSSAVYLYVNVNIQCVYYNIYVCATIFMCTTNSMRTTTISMCILRSLCYTAISMCLL